MGIVNCTPDSFFSSSQNASKESVEKCIEKHLIEQVDILDLGGYSTRPNASEVTVQEEIDRLGVALELCKKNAPEIPVSVDTFRSEVAQFSFQQGAKIINDVSGGKLDDKMFETVAKNQMAYILMHSRGNSQTMQSLTNYDLILKDIAIFFSEQIAKARQIGIKDIALDLGFGFAKTIQQNFTLLKNQRYFNLFELPILTGVSRKSMIYKTLDTTAENALNGTTFLHAIALNEGAKILRVHDVKEAKECVKLFLELRYA